MRELRERRGDGIARDEGTSRSVLNPLHGFLPGPNSEKPTARAREGAVDASVTAGACNAPESSIRGRAPTASMHLHQRDEEEGERKDPCSPGPDARPQRRGASDLP